MVVYKKVVKFVPVGGKKNRHHGSGRRGGRASGKRKSYKSRGWKKW